MGAGQITGATPTVWHYFRPQDGSAYVLVWLGTVFVLSCVFAWWVFLASGARKVVELNLMAALGQHGSKPPPENMVKLFAARSPDLGLHGGVNGFTAPAVARVVGAAP
jgi:hypothetical protein